MKRLEQYRDRVDERALFWFPCLCLLFAWPVISADILHRDDIWRAAKSLLSS